ncbi:hypothetical protein T05_14785 [Trichinella murrelli]|uniref:Uncharacterized protein n=1 Tax=Trichinella murrelli TaxID=144512 RepID=A0A0V0T560_9BILA|nr:hypothetical protein T05_14785 [Trichinella murrelli]
MTIKASIRPIPVTSSSFVSWITRVTSQQVSTQQITLLITLPFLQFSIYRPNSKISAARGDSSHTASRSATAVWRNVAPSCLRLKWLLQRLASRFVGLTVSVRFDRDSCMRYSDKSPAIVSFALLLSSQLILTVVRRQSRLKAIVVSDEDSSPSQRPPFLRSFLRVFNASIVRLRKSYCKRRPTSYGCACMSFLI